MFQYYVVNYITTLHEAVNAGVGILDKPLKLQLPSSYNIQQKYYTVHIALLYKLTGALSGAL